MAEQPGGPNGQMSQDQMRALTQPRPMPCAYQLSPAHLQSGVAGQPDLYMVEEHIYSANGEFVFYWDITSSRQRAARLRETAAMADQARSGLITPESPEFRPPPPEQRRS